MFEYKDDRYYPYLYFDTKAGTEVFFLDGHRLEEEPYFFRDLIDAFDNPLPIGSLLCKCLNLLSDIFSHLKELDGSDPYIQEAERIKLMIESAFPVSEEYNTSIDELGLLLKMAFCCDKPERFDMDRLEFNQLVNYFNFAQLCAENKEYHSVEQLYKFSTLICYKLKNGFVSPDRNPVIEKEYKLTMWEIKGYLDRLISNDLDQTEAPQYYELYGVDSLADFIAISLYQLFLSGRSISHCRICGRYFIPKKLGTLYCDRPNPTYNNRTCREQAKLQKQLRRTQMSESQRLHRSVAQMLRARVYAEQLEYAELTNFLDKSKAFRMQVKNGQVAEWEYIKWLHSFYKRKYKARR